MNRQGPETARSLPEQSLTCDLAVIGGGLAGTCCAITAARAGLNVVLLQDRPVLGGNASSEVRLWALGATHHMGNNNRFSREGGVMGEIFVENFARNPEGNPVLFDALLLEKAQGESSLTLLLNTAVQEVVRDGEGPVTAVRGYCSQNQTYYRVAAPYFCDASGDGVVAYQAGAAFHMGAEDREEFAEGFAPDEGFGQLLGHSIYFLAKDVGKPVRFVAPEWAYRDIEDRIPRHKLLNPARTGCHLWWMEYGGRLDTIAESENIKWELWRVVYGVWDYMKNSGKFPEAETMTLEWMGLIPGKRESRRFEGPHMLTQADVVQRRRRADDVAHGGWSIDLHPADGLYSEIAPSLHLHAAGVYPIPLRCCFSRNVPNLFLAGRIISASHVAFGTTRVMATGAVVGQAVGMAAAVCLREKLTPAELAEPDRAGLLQRELLRTGQHIPGVALDDPDDLARRATVSATSELDLADLPADGPWQRLDRSTGLWVPAEPGPVPPIGLTVRAEADTTVRVELRTAELPDETTPCVTLASAEIDVPAGADHEMTVDLGAQIDTDRYVMLAVMANEHVSVKTTSWRVSGVSAVRYGGSQRGLEDRGGQSFEFWMPTRRPGGHAMAARWPGVGRFAPANVTNGLQRPTAGANAWVASLDDPTPALTLTWPEPVTVGRVELAFDVDYDHAMETVHYGHPEWAVPMCVRSYVLRDAAGNVLAESDANHQARAVHRFDAVTTDRLTLEVRQMNGQAPAAVFEVRAYEN